MSAAIVTPDLDRLRSSNVSPARLREKLKAAGLDPNLARERRPEIPVAKKLDFRTFGRFATQRVWTGMLLRMVSGEPR